MNIKGIFNTIAALWHHGFSAQWQLLKSSLSQQWWLAGSSALWQ